MLRLIKYDGEIYVADNISFGGESSKLLGMVYHIRTGKGMTFLRYFSCKTFLKDITKYEH